MASLQEKLGDYVEDAHAMERSVLPMLDTVIDQIDDAQIRTDFEHHREETVRHEQRLRERLDAMGRGASTVKDIGGALTAMVKGMADVPRGDRPKRFARDAYASEHMEIAAYELLERFATRAGDEATAVVARDNRAEEEAMAQRIAGCWDRFVDLTIAEEHLVV
jgi:ferritin-like metal-binding protein YciE